MLKINAIKILINTTEGKFGADFEFDKGLNVFRADNSSGKSTIVQSIIYALGLEEILGGVNATPMPYVLRDYIEYEEENIPIIDSMVFLEIENSEVVTLQRYIKSNEIDPKLVNVYFGAKLTQNEECRVQPYYLHDAGGASDPEFGFHAFLENFLDKNLPTVDNVDGKDVKLYLQMLFPAFVIEQKRGWSGFLSTQPYYKIRNASSRSIEYLLGLDVFESIKKKQLLEEKLKKIKTRWDNFYEKIEKHADKGNLIINGISKSIALTNEELKDVRLYHVNKDNEYTSLKDYVELLQNELNEFEKAMFPKVGESANENEQKLNEKENRLIELEVRIQNFDEELFLEQQKLSNLRTQLIEVDNDLKKNKGAKKIRSLGGKLDIRTAEGECPTCGQEVPDSLLPKTSSTPMRIDENIKYIESQKKMLSAYIEGQEQKIQDRKALLLNLADTKVNLRQEIRSLKRELTSDNRLPSEQKIREKIELEKKVVLYYQILENFEEQSPEASKIISIYKKIKEKIVKLPTEYFSVEDKGKLDAVQTFFRRNLEDFGYRSKSIRTIKISRDKYLPISEGFDLNLVDSFDRKKSKDVKLEFDSSASDFVRAIWAYSCALLQASLNNGGNHFNLLIFDEPAQHSMSAESTRKLLETMSEIQGDTQQIVFASFDNNENVYEDSTRGVDFNEIRFLGDKIIEPI
jgi:DNA repair exonuclease SbcCD ATPase subunit